MFNGKEHGWLRALIRSADGIWRWTARHPEWRFIPTPKPLLDLHPERVLVTHGAPVLGDGRAKLASAPRSKPWNRRSAASA